MLLKVNQVRCLEWATVVSDKPPAEHAEIVLDLGSARIPTMDALEADPDLFARFDAACVELAKISQRGK